MRNTTKRASKSLAPQALEDPVLGSRLLGNGRYCILVNSAGAGFSWFDRHLLSKWDGDFLLDRDGFFLWIRDVETGEVFPAGVAALSEGAAAWEPGCFEIRRAGAGFESRLEIVVGAREPLELRRLTLRNETDRARTFEITSHIEIALSDPGAFAAHPSFSKLFIETDAANDGRTLVARRRSREPGEQHPWLVHAINGAHAVGATHSSDSVEWETDRGRFFRRGDFGILPHAISSGESLSGTVGNVLDPIFALRRRCIVQPGGEETVTFLMGAAPDRTSAIALASILGKPGTVDRAIEDAKQRAVAVIEACGLSLEDAEEIQEHIGSLFDARDEEMPAEIDQVRQFAGALGAPVRELGFSRTELDRPRSARGAIASSSRPRRVAKRTEKNPEQSPATSEPATTPPPREERDRSEDLLFFNGYGGFAKAGNEYVIPISRRESGGLQLPPRPWINVLANERFGCLVSETGAGMTWSENSREYRLTPWANDPLCDPHSEALYIRDEESGAFWSPLPGPAPGSGRYEARHGFGISTFVHTGADFEEKTEIFVPRRDSVKITSIRIRNRSGRARTLSFISFARLVLGSDTRASAPFLSIEEGPYEGSLFATSERSGDFAGRTAFAGFATQAHVRAAHVSGDREGFAGRRETLAHPRALAPGSTLDGIVGSDLDPCFAQQIVLELAAGEEAVVSFLLGDGADANESEALLNQYSDPNTLQSERDAAIAEWDARLSAIHLETPSPALDLLMNGWLMHQVLACRMRGRSALYQSGGAYGFRDQLQDSSSLALVHPEITRRQILLHAAHQFPEGDVLHWWHPPQSRGIRTRFADDLLWLPYLTAEYVRTTGDEELLDERARFVAAPLLDAGEDERYLLPKDSGTNASVFEHCLRAIDRALPRKGAHRLPLFGSGDWNDGMNRVGHAGRGESVWMGFFLVSVLDAFAPLCERRGDVERAKRYRAERAALQDALNDAGWDGEWYRRGYYDGGEPLGSAQSDECRIDALAQAWAVLSRAAPPERSSQAMRSVERHLLSEEEGLIRLLTPAFRDTPLDPGYIKGYTAGVRENGGQYTHAALWVVAAFAELGRNDRVAPLLDLLNPIHHARTADEVHRYQVEPYVIAADVYGEAPHVGRGGWTWYTGSAGWMIRVAMESLLGIRVEGGNTLTIRPCIPDEWPGFNVRLRLSPEQTVLRIHAANPDRRARTVIRATIDGRSAPVESGTARVPLARDGGEHDIEIVLGDADDGPSPAGRMSIA